MNLKLNPYLLFAILPIGASITGCGKAAAEPSATDAKVAVSVDMTIAESRTLRALVHLQGSFVSAQGQSARLAPTAPGRVTTVLVKEGQQVKSGQLLATFDTRVQAAQGASAASAVGTAQAQALQFELTARAAAADQRSALRTAQLGLQSAYAEKDADIKQNKIGLATARADLARLVAGARPQERAQAHQAVIQAQVANNKAQADYRRNQQLAVDGFVSKKDLEDSKAAADTAKASLTTAKEAESLLLAGARSQELEVAKLRVASAAQSLRSAQALGDRKIALAQAAVQQAKTMALSVRARQQDAVASSMGVQQKVADARAASASVAIAEIRAPFSGKITRRMLNPGDLADTMTPVLEMTGSGQVDFVGTLPAGEAIDLSAGMAATVENDGKPVAGRVASVSGADATSGLSSIRIVCGAHALPGTFSTANVVTAVHKNAVAVPSEAVVTQDGKPVVFIVEGDTAKQTPVTIGAEDGGFTEILTGVKVGTKLVKLGQYELSDGAKIKATEPPAPDGVGDKAAPAGAK